MKKCSEYVRPIDSDCAKGLIAGIGSVESSFLVQSAICNIENIPDYASLLVLINYLIQIEVIIFFICIYIVEIQN